MVIENVLVADELCTDVDTMESRIRELGADAIACVVSTTSVFAPRAPDRYSRLRFVCLRIL